MSEPVTLSRRRLRSWLRMLRVMRKTEIHLRDFLRTRFDTTLPRFDVAAALYRAEAPMTMSALSQMLLVSNGNATSIVDRLEKDGKVRRIPDEADKRVVRVELTAEGRAWFKTMAAAHEAEVDGLLSGLGHGELDRLRDLLRLVEESEERHRHKAED